MTWAPHTRPSKVSTLGCPSVSSHPVATTCLGVVWGTAPTHSAPPPPPTTTTTPYPFPRRVRGMQRFDETVDAIRTQFPRSRISDMFLLRIVDSVQGDLDRALILVHKVCSWRRQHSVDSISNEIENSSQLGFPHAKPLIQHFPHMYSL